MIVSARDFSGNLERKESSMARKSLVAVVLAAGLMALGCGKTAMLTPSPAMVATVTGSVSPGIDGLATAWVAPNAYQMVGSVSYDMVTDEDISDRTVLGIGFKYLLKPIDNDETPNGLQEFLKSKGHAAVNIDMTSWDEAGYDDDMLWMVDGAYTLPQLDGKLTPVAMVGGGTLWGDNVDVFGFAVGAQYAILDDLKATLKYQSTAVDAGAGVEWDVADIILDVRYALVNKWGLKGWDFDLNVDLLTTDGLLGGEEDHTIIGIDVTGYILKELGVSVGYVMDDGEDDSGGSTITLGAKYYTGPMAVGVTYGMESLDAAGSEDVTTIGIKAEYRF